MSGASSNDISLTTRFIHMKGRNGLVNDGECIMIGKRFTTAASAWVTRLDGGVGGSDVPHKHGLVRMQYGRRQVMTFC